MDSEAVLAILAKFNVVWEALALREQVRVIELLVDSVAYDAQAGRSSITLRTAMEAQSENAAL